MAIVVFRALIGNAHTVYVFDIVDRLEATARMSVDGEDEKRRSDRHVETASQITN